MSLELLPSLLLLLLLLLLETWGVPSRRVWTANRTEKCTLRWDLGVGSQCPFPPPTLPKEEPWNSCQPDSLCCGLPCVGCGLTRGGVPEQHNTWVCQVPF
ncbi:hypothetical protein CRUP_006991 [Coryphaenoides rupestris]|nr:hypothetical protein CRUP_006991 [Coryphaenoides rupestris]